MAHCGSTISADGELPVTDSFDAPDSNQVAQRNVQLEDCGFPLTNATGSDGNVEIALTVSPPETAPSLNMTPDISVTFDDADSAWYGIWSIQPENGTLYSVIPNGNQTIVRLGQANVTLHPVPLANGESRNAPR